MPAIIDDQGTTTVDSGSIEEFGPYQVLGCLGKGGMATVHKARKTGIEGFERVDALKRLLPHLEADRQFVRSFVHEAKLAAQLTHGNIVQIHDLGKVGERYFIAMEFLDGKSVQDILKQAAKVAGPPPLAVAMSIIGELLDALDYAHSRTDLTTDQNLGTVHADVTPSNLIVSEAGNLKVIDFGIARASSDRQRKRGVFVAGKIGYMAPEVMDAAGIDARSDLFAVGVIAHELLTARPLFKPRQASVVRKTLETGFSRPSLHNNTCPPQIDDIVMTALEADPNRRFSCASAMRTAIDTALHSIGVASTRREVAVWLEQSFQLDPRHGRNKLAAGSRRRTFPLPALPDVEAELFPPDAVAGSRPPIGEDDEETGEHWSSVVDAPALVTEDLDISESIRNALTDRDAVDAIDPPTQRRGTPRISSPPIDTGLIPKITFRAPTVPGTNNDDN